METNNSQPRTYEDPFEQLIAEIVADPEVRAEMLQPEDVQNNSANHLTFIPECGILRA